MYKRLDLQKARLQKVFTNTVRDGEFLDTYLVCEDIANYTVG